MRTMMLAALAAFALPCAAWAGPGTIGTIPPGFKEVAGRMDAPPVQRWLMKLARGHVYAVLSLSDSGGNVSVHAAGGRTLVAFAMAGEDGWHGARFRAPYSGTYILHVACTTDGAQPPCPGWYALAVGNGR